MYKVGILDGQSVQAVAFAKSLKSRGHKTVLFCEKKISFGYYTKYSYRSIISPPIKPNSHEFKDFFFEYINKFGLDVAIPMNDESAMFLSHNKDVLKDKINFILPNYKTFIRGYHKNKLMALCKDHSFPHPQTIDLSKTQELETNKTFKFPAVIKPNQGTGSRGFRFIQSMAHLKKTLAEYSQTLNEHHIQTIVPKGGKQYKVQLLRVDSKIVAHSAIEKLRYYPVAGGSSCYNVSIVENNLVSLCSKVLEKLDWNGFADFDLIEDPVSKEVLILEMNPRPPACIKSSIISGVDFPELILKASLGEKLSFDHNYNQGQYLRYLSFDVLWLYSSGLSISNIKIFLKNLLSRNHYFQDFNIFDIRSFIFGIIGGIKDLIRDKNKKNIFEKNTNF